MKLYLRITLLLDVKLDIPGYLKKIVSFPDSFEEGDEG